MSIPVLMSDGTAFPERDLIILIAGGVIVLSLLITSFILPFCVEKNKEIDKNAEDQAYLEILQNAITELEKNATPENADVTALVIANFHNRIFNLQQKQISRKFTLAEKREMKKKLYLLKKEHAATMLEHSKIDANAIQHYQEKFLVVVARALQIERDNIRAMHEVGRISRETERELQHNISVLEVQMKKEYL
jgi:CPA1 family monovalent cation:H+ antiporter